MFSFYGYLAVVGCVFHEVRDNSKEGTRIIFSKNIILN